ncbi:PIG-L family deacetylase [Bacillus velezensis]
MAEYIMVIGAHPDDELLGSKCLGTIKRLINEGYKVISIITALGRKKKEAHHIKQLGRTRESRAWN